MIKRRCTAPQLIGRPFLWLAVVCSLLIFGLAYFSPAKFEGSDPHLSLLVSQAILEHGTTRLDAYRDRAEPPLDSYPTDSGPLVVYNGHYYYAYPIGTSILSLPFVWVANQLGKDMALAADNHQTQNLLSAFSSALEFLLILAICRCLVNEGESLLIALVSVAGSALLSTLGTALWSINLGVIFISLALLLLVRYESGQSSSLHPHLLGICLFAAYSCRASTASFILVMLAYIWLVPRLKPEAPKASATAFVLLVAFMNLSWLQYGSLFPEYYSVSRFEEHQVPLLLALYGHFLSPSRGLFVFSPFFILVPIGAAWFVKELRKQHFFWFCLSWLVLLFISVWRGARWWGGYSFGPRILTEAIPAFVLLTAVLWRLAKERLSLRTRRVLVGGYILLGFLGILINSYQGLMNLNANEWNGPLPPDVDRHPEYLFDWRYPQFLATRESICQRNLEYSHDGLRLDPGRLGEYALGQAITYQNLADDARGDDRKSYKQAFLPANIWENAKKLLSLSRRDAPGAQVTPAGSPLREGGDIALGVGWSVPEPPGFRWSQCPVPQILFRLGNIDITRSYTLEIVSGSAGPQEVSLLLNGRDLGRLNFPGPHYPPVTRTLSFKGTWLDPNDINYIEFRIPQAQQASATDPRIVGLALVSLRIIP